MSEQRLIDGTKATKEVMEYSRKLHEAGNVDAAGYVMWAASIVDEQPTIDPVKHGYVLSSVHEQVQWERDIAIDQLHSYGIEFGEKAEMQRVRHGKWIKTFRYMGKNLNTGEVIPVNSYDCSECGYHTGNQGRKFNYCPNCGAKMDKE